MSEDEANVMFSVRKSPIARFELNSEYKYRYVRITNRTSLAIVDPTWCKAINAW